MGLVHFPGCHSQIVTIAVNALRAGDAVEVTALPLKTGLLEVSRPTRTLVVEENLLLDPLPKIPPGKVGRAPAGAEAVVVVAHVALGLAAAASGVALLTFLALGPSAAFLAGV